MTNAYKRIYLSDTMESLAALIDCGVYGLGVPLKKLWAKFLASSICYKLYRGDPFVVAGKSGLELAFEVVGRENKEYTCSERHPEYWLGFYLAYYSWYTNVYYGDLDKYISIEELLSLYHPYHEMDVTKFVDRVNEIYNEKKQITNLEYYRKERKLSRKRLSELSGVSSRLIEQYEQKRKNINKANVSSVLNLARALSTQIEDILEPGD